MRQRRRLSSYLFMMPERVLEFSVSEKQFSSGGIKSGNPFFLSSLHSHVQLRFAMLSEWAQQRVRESQN